MTTALLLFVQDQLRRQLEVTGLLQGEIHTQATAYRQAKSAVKA